MALFKFDAWSPGMADDFEHIPSQNPDPVREMERQSRWLCTEPRQDTAKSFDKSKYKVPRLPWDTAPNRRFDAGLHRNRALERFCDALWTAPQRKTRTP